jgi:uncharacterized protein (TIGR03000 family)
MLRYLVPVLVGLGMLSMNPFVDAKGGGGGGGHGGGGGGHGGGGHGGGHASMGGRGGSMNHGGNFNHSHNNFNHGNFNRGGAFFYGGFYPGYASPYWYNYGPGNYDYGYAAPSAVYVNPSYSNPGYLNPNDAVPSMPSAAGLNNTAEIDVTLPRADAKVWVDGTPMTEGTGAQRAFVSPTLEAGYSYSYRVTASWMENGQEVRVERRVPVSPGRVSIMDFTKVNTNPKMPPAPE